MPDTGHGGNGFAPLMEALYDFHADLKRRADLCVAHEKTSAVHETNAKALQVYRLHPSEQASVEYLRAASDSLSTWEEAILWDWEGGEWEKVERNINARMKKHKKLLPILTRGVVWQSRPILIHAYKFETDPVMKVELIVPDSRMSAPEFALHAISSTLECHQFLLPDYAAISLPPYTRHETKFVTPVEYLARTLPEDLYTLCCFPSLVRTRS